MKKHLSSPEQQKRSLWQKMRRGMKAIGLVLLGLLLVGFVYEPLAEQAYVKTHKAPGQLFQVGNHQLHIHCTGSGSPTVVLEAGLGETSYSMAGWIAPAVAQVTRVCVYDRAGYGWSEAAVGPRDGMAVTTDLHTLLAQAQEKGPYILAGHSTGGAYVRLFAARYPAEVAGMVLLDAQPNEALTRLPDYPTFYAVFSPVTKLLPYVARVGIAQLFAFASQTGLPAAANEGAIAAGMTVHQYRAQRDEFAGIPAALTQAQALQSLGNKPLIVVTAPLDAQKGWLVLQAEMTKLSTNSVQRVIPNATHESLIENEVDAVASSQAILDVVTAVRSAQPLGNSALPVHAASAPRFPLEQLDQDRIDAYIQASMAAANIPGLALGVVYGDQVVYLKGYGVAGPDGRAVTPQTPFILGSTSKSFTALAIIQLVEAGKIDLDAAVTTYLPWFRTRDDAASAQITVRHLLNQNSGLPTYAGRQGLADNDQSSMALENGVRALSSVQLSQPAGQGYEYANENYDILGLIVQTVSGQSYEEYVRAAIFAPLQMNHSAAALADPAAAELATGYRNWLFWPVAFAAPYPRRTTPAGFLISSAENMTHYLAAQLNDGRYGNHQLLSAQGMATLHTPGAKMGAGSAYGMGWVIQGQPGSRKIWHNGDVSNFHSNLLLLPDQRIGIVILINVSRAYNGTALNMPMEGVAAILRGERLTASTNPAVTVIPQMLLLATLLIPLLWIVVSYLSIRRWRQRGELPLRGIHRFWRLYLPLAIDVFPVGIAWIIVPARFHTPMTTLALFAPDLFFVIVTLTVLSLGWAIARIFFTLHPRRLLGSVDICKAHT